jgi:hypothetical protein
LPENVKVIWINFFLLAVTGINLITDHRLIALGLAIISGLLDIHYFGARRLLHGRHRADVVPPIGYVRALIQRIIIQPIRSVAAPSIAALPLILQERVGITYGPTARHLSQIRGRVPLFGCRRPSPRQSRSQPFSNPRRREPQRAGQRGFARRGWRGTPIIRWATSRLLGALRLQPLSV